jgi:DNA-binding transcriptional regulator YiaG
MRKVSVESRSFLRSPVEHDVRFERIIKPLLDVDLSATCAGKFEAVHAYVQAWREVGASMLLVVREDEPDLHEPPQLADAIEAEALQAPFSVWVGEYGTRGLALGMLARIRTLLIPQAQPLPAPAASTGPVNVDATAARRFRRRVLAELHQSDTAAAQIREAFDLNMTELGELFGVSRQAVAQWPGGEVPASKRGKAGVVMAIVDVLSHRLKAGRLPLVSRRPAVAYGGLTMLEMIEQDRHEELLESIRWSFDYAVTT